MIKKYPGVSWSEDDRGKGPFMIRIGGTNEFVSKVNPDDPRCSPPGSVDVVVGWNNPAALKFKTLERALKVADQVFQIEGFHNSIETVQR